VLLIGAKLVVYSSVDLKCILFFAEVNPLQKVPAIVHGSFNLSQR